MNFGFESVPTDLTALSRYPYPMGYRFCMLEVRQIQTYAEWFKGLRDRTAQTRIDIASGGCHLVTQATSSRSVTVSLNSVLITGRATACTSNTPWDPADHLHTEEDMAAYLEAALENADPALIAAALGDIARAKGMAQVARVAGLGRESLYKALSPDGNPEFATILKVVAALGLQLHATPVVVKGAA